MGASLLPGPATMAAYRRPVSQLGGLAGRMAGDSVLRRTGVKRDTQRALSMLILWHVKESPPNASVKVKRPHGELGGLVCSQLCSFLALSPWARGLTSLVPLVPLM